MHICLLPAEILLDIFDSIDPDGFGSGTNRSMVAVLARTCRTFKEPALDILWRDVIGFKPLILCLPEGVRGQVINKELPKKIPRQPTGKPASSPQKQLTLNRPLFAKEWNIFNSYACRIRSLTITSSHLNDIDERVMTVLTSALTPTLLPNLHKLQWVDSRDAFLPLLHALLAPTIKSMVLSPFWEYSFAKSALLVSLGARCPHIQEFTCGNSGEQSDALWETIRCWSKLTHLDAGVLDSQNLTYLASLPLLRSLRIVSRDFIDGTRPKSIQAFTSRINKVSISAPSLPVLTQCLRSVRFMSCQSVALNVVDIDHDPWILGNLILSLSKCFSPDLEQFTVDFDDISTMESADPHLALGFDAISPLLPFGHLTVVDLDWICSSAIDDAMVQKMALSWPHLERFRLGTGARWPIPLSLTFTGLIHLIRHCCYLQSISMAFCASRIDANSQLFSQTIPNEKITIISVGGSPIEDTISVACQLHTLLPNLGAVRCSTWGGIPTEPLFEQEWNRATEFLKVLIEGARMKQEQARAQGECSSLA